MRHTREHLAKVTQTSEWNLGRQENILAIIAGSEPNIPCVDNWYRVSRHAAGVDSAYVVQSKMRRRFPQLNTRVVNTTANKSVKWNAEIWVQLKGDE